LGTANEVGLVVAELPNDTPTILITGGMGFVGSTLIRRVRLTHPMWRIVNVDLLTYAANPANLDDVDTDSGYEFVQADIADAAAMRELFNRQPITYVVNCAAESHVDRAIDDGAPFIHSNIQGTAVLLEAARRAGVKRFVQVGTDEVYGSLDEDEAPFTEDSMLNPRSPYSASKAAADMLALAYHHTYQSDVVITRSANNYGPRQHPEKLIPFMITAAIAGRTLPIYGDGKQRRDWMHVTDHAAGLIAALEHGTAGRIYNLSSGFELENGEVVRMIADIMHVEADRVVHVADRPGHDRRYAMSSDRARTELGWSTTFGFGDGLRETVEWYRDNAQSMTASAANAHADSDRRLAQWAGQ
jgi:dTDP-glucose 4,6-dehydratase